ncbi:Tyrosine recombinase XerC [Calidithermus terrae]|uniref:Tyrosine recombinase XerC n=1 Tax=Calidithermus terrae TaxID=1408545 RepID=A0A399ECN5_9DEIN|nr:tyrosine-type recombinase/integrase [Calidithermus terrae]RIH82414.1 Tyrosine recombinase XerC [Calidithermus terrae]
MRVEAAVKLLFIYLRSQGAKPGTLEHFEHTMGHFRRFCEGKQVAEVEEVSHWLVREYWLYLLERGLAVSGYARDLHRFFSFLKEEGLWGRENPVKQAGVPKQADRPIKPIPPEALEAMLKAAARGRNPWRDRALILLLVDTGLRVCEALSIRLEDVNTETRCVWVRGKGDKDRPAFYGYRVARFLNAYVAKERKAQPGVGYLFTTDEGEPFSRLRVRDMLRQVARRAGLDPAKVNVHPHAFRHTFAVRYLLHGGTALGLRRRLGHSTMEMVDRYVSMSVEDLAAEHDRVSPGDWLLGRKNRAKS